jgi:hypothetical protein
MTEFVGVLEVTETRVQRVKNWCGNHKGELLTAAGVVLVGIAAVIYNNQREQIEALSSENDVLRNRQPKIENNPTVNNNVYNIELVERANLSKPVQIIRADGSSGTYNSMNEATRQTEYTMNQLHKAMQGETLYDGTTVISLKDAA